MEDFPAIEAGQVALLKADTRTGHVLATDNTVFISNVKDIYTVFENLEVAEKYVAEERLKTENSFEYYFYDYNQNMLLAISGFNGTTHRQVNVPK